MGIGDWGLGIGDWGLGPIPNPQSPIPNPQSPFLYLIFQFINIKSIFSISIVNNHYKLFFHCIKENFDKKMTSQLTTLNERDKPKSNYQLNMEILTSLKSLPGKVINLQNEKFHFPNEGKDKGKPNLAEEKKTTSSSIPNELFYDPFNDMEKSNKCFNTTNSIFKPMTCFQNKSPTMNSFELNSRMSYPYYFPYNQNITNLSNPAKFSNLSFSQNSFILLPIKILK